jgi:hypothetical protein
LHIDPRRRQSPESSERDRLAAALADAGSAEGDALQGAVDFLEALFTAVIEARE